MVFVSLLLVVVVVLAGCGPRATGGELAQSAEESEVVVDLPALVLDIQSDGQASVGGMTTTDLANLGVPGLDAVVIPTEMVNMLIDNNIQHFQIDNTQNGLLILVNGKPIPSLAWDGESLVATAEVLDTLSPGGIALLDKVLPLILNVGVGVILRIPVAEGTDILPYVVTDDETAERFMAAQQEFLDAVGTPPTFQLVVTYDDDGSWSIAGISEEEWAQLAPMLGGALDPLSEAVLSASEAGIDELGIATNEKGLFLSINGKTLPYITWEDGRINHVLDLVLESGMLPGVASDPNTANIIEMVESLLPAILASDVNLIIRLP
jgi:hypothetical protein